MSVLPTDVETGPLESDACLPAGAARTPAAARMLAAARWLARLGSHVYESPLGAWLLRRHLHGPRELSRVEIPLQRGHADLDGLRVGFVSDVHAGHYMNERDLLQMFGRLAHERPDLVLLGGDLVNLFVHEVGLLRKPLELLEPPLGVFAVPGNHEYDTDPGLEVWAQMLVSCGVEPLINAGRRITRGQASFWLAGVDDLHHGQPCLPRALTGRETDEPVVLMSHQPDLFPQAATAGVDLTLSGHTHGGQVLVAGRTPLRHTAYGYWSGAFSRDGAQLYVSRGAGVSLLPLRIGTRAEICVLTLRCG